MDILFSISNFFVVPFWFLMIFLPHWSWTKRVMRFPWMIVLLALVYGVLALSQIGTLAPALARPSMNGIAEVLGTPIGATIAWVHFLAFDLFVGRWIYFDSRERGVSVWLCGPCLFLTLMLGPLGLLCYLGVRAFYNPSETKK